ncbi:hypothetical protein [Fodinicurvata halophila]|uniref:hypothetical protein n=1 Tax=Fodinicurvata halophila TaxID=1419723 RepID=UPI00363D2CB6
MTQISDTLPDDPDFEMRRQAAVKLQGAIVAAGATSDDPVLGAIDLARERQRLAQRDVESLLDRAASAEHPVYRDRYLARAGDALMDQAGHFAPQAVAEALEDGAESGALADFLDSLQRLSTQLDDVFGSESGFGPTGDFLGGLNAAAEVAEMRGEEATASEIAGIINDIGGAAGEGIYLKPFATQFGAITGQVGQARDGWDATSSAIQGVADAVGGDLTGLERAEAAADQVAEALNPENMVSAMVEGAAGAFDTLIPGTRGAATNVLASIFG